MNQEKQREAYEKMLKKCPDILTPMKANRWSPVGKNTSYTEICNGKFEIVTDGDMFKAILTFRKYS